MFVRRFYDERVAQASYLVGCQQTGEAIVIDPARDVAQYLDVAKQQGLRITRVTETHIHADFVSGTQELAAATGAQILLSGEGGDDWQYQFGDVAARLHDGDVITIGGVQLDVIHTPGHTPEHLAFVVTDMAKSPEPIGIITGDFVFVGDVGRPDLLDKVAGGVNTREAGAGALFDSLQRLAPYADYIQVWPGHGAGSACGKALGAVPSSTMGYERRTNWAFKSPDKASFVATVLDGQPAPPRYFAAMKRINRSGPPLLGERAAMTPLDAGELATALRDGTVIDVRTRAEWQGRHVMGSLNLPPIAAFTKWAGWLVPEDRNLYLIAANANAAEAARAALAAIGFDRVGGFFTPDVITESNSSAEVQGTIGEAEGMHASGRTIVDIREQDEWDAGHLPFAEHHPLGTLPAALAGLDRNTPIALHCQGGTRSGIGVSALESLGFTDVIDLTDGWSGMKQ